MPEPDVLVGGWLSLNKAKSHLNIPANVSTLDTEVAEFLSDVDNALRPRIGRVGLPADPISVYCDGGRQGVRVDELPVGLVVAITVTGTVVPPADRDTGAHGWYLSEREADRRAGIIRHTDRFPHGFVKVTYKPGRPTVPTDITRGAFELLRHLWATQRGTGSGTRQGLMGGEAPDGPEAGPRGGSVPMGFTWPKRVLELVGPYTLPVAG